jgi:hypothetical protein
MTDDVFFFSLSVLALGQSPMLAFSRRIYIDLPHSMKSPDQH